ncbi:IS5 family transposase [Streptomyces sp. NPDC052051]|uniref:IS5 family transposase n=1 Tax=Streptomyces sp. NPDC052051 TaxID=3154649 RepID=UPI00342F3B9E
MVETLIPETLWELFQRVVPSVPTRPQGGGRRRHGDREVLAAIVFVATTGCTWRQLPPVFGPSGSTAHRRFVEWTKARVFAKLHRLVLHELGSRGELDWSRCAIDSVNMRALKEGDLTGPNPVDRGKYGSKIHLITERTGLPLSVGISGANVHDSQALIPLTDSVTRDLLLSRKRLPTRTRGPAIRGHAYGFLSFGTQDSWNLRAFRRGAELLFQVLTERGEKNSVAIASNESAAGEDVHLPAALRGHRRPAHLQRRDHPRPAPSHSLSPTPGLWRSRPLPAEPDPTRRCARQPAETQSRNGRSRVAEGHRRRRRRRRS